MKKKKKRKIHIKLLRLSEEHWRRLYSGDTRPGEDSTGDNCPLCKRYHDGFADYGKACDGCPVKRFTGKNVCAGTPWLLAHEVVVDRDAGCDITPAGAALILREAEFLEYLALDLELHGRSEPEPGEEEKFDRRRELALSMETYRKQKIVIV
jgi:hypothetical protein